jgi:hypothetical protein
MDSVDSYPPSDIINSNFFLPFRFAETEGIAILTLLVSRYRIELADEPELRHETIEQARMRLTTARFKLGVLTLVSYTYCEHC